MTMDARPDELHDVLDCGPETLGALADRIDESDQEIRQIYRETEIDEVWRWVDVMLMQAQHEKASGDVIAHWMSVKTEVMDIHDLVGIDSDLKAAAVRLRRLADRLTATPMTLNGR